MRKLICTFIVRIWHKQVFSWRGSFDPLSDCYWEILLKSCFDVFDKWLYNYPNNELPIEYSITVKVIKNCKSCNGCAIYVELIAFRINVLHFKESCFGTVRNFNKGLEMNIFTYCFKLTSPCVILRFEPPHYKTNKMACLLSLVMKQFLRPFSPYHWFK